MSQRPLRYHQPFPIALRVMLAICAMIPLWGAYDLLIAPGMNLLQLGLTPFLIMGLIALAFGTFFLSVALFGGARTVTIDRSMRACVVEFDGTFGMHYRFVHPFSTLADVRVRELPTSDPPGHWAVELPSPRKAIIVETYPEEAGARAEAERIGAYIAGR